MYFNLESLLLMQTCVINHNEPVFQTAHKVGRSLCSIRLLCASDYLFSHLGGGGGGGGSVPPCRTRRSRLSSSLISDLVSV